MPALRVALPLTVAAVTGAFAIAARLDLGAIGVVAVTSLLLAFGGVLVVRSQRRAIGRGVPADQLWETSTAVDVIVPLPAEDALALVRDVARGALKRPTITAREGTLVLATAESVWHGAPELEVVATSTDGGTRLSLRTRPGGALLDGGTGYTQLRTLVDAVKRAGKGAREVQRPVLPPREGA
jgi:hypothetical protein